MTQDHLQLHGQFGSNGEESGSNSWVEGGGDKSWLELKKIIAQENDQGKHLSSQLIQHSKFHTNFIASQCSIGCESFQQRHHFSEVLPSCHFKSGALFPDVFPNHVDVSKISATCNEPLNHFKVSTIRCTPQWGASVFIRESDIDTRILQQHGQTDKQGKRKFVLCDPSS